MRRGLWLSSGCQCWFRTIGQRGVELAGCGYTTKRASKKKLSDRAKLALSKKVKEGSSRSKNYIPYLHNQLILLMDNPSNLSLPLSISTFFLFEPILQHGGERTSSKLSPPFHFAFARLTTSCRIDCVGMRKHLMDCFHSFLQSSTMPRTPV